MDFRTTFSAIIDKIRQRMQFNVHEARSHYKIFGWVLIVSYIGFYFVNRYFATPEGYENIYLRMGVSICGSLLIARRYWPKIMIKYEPILFYLVLLYALPFFFTYMLLCNQTSNMWQINELVGLTLLTFFVDWISYLVLLLLGAMLAYLAASYHNPGFEVAAIFWQVASSCSAPVIYFIIFAREKEEIYKQKSDYIEHIKQLSNSLEQKVTERTGELQKALDIKTEILNNLNHEIRTPIQGFTNISEGLIRHWYTFDDEKKFSLARQITANATRLSSLVEHLLDLSRFTSGKMLFDFHVHDLNNVIEDVIEECVMLYLTDKNIDIKFVRNENLEVQIDRDRIAQVLRNLFTNAIKFSPVASTITVTTKKLLTMFNGQTQTVVNFTMTDQGMGIPEKELVRIFEPFNQSNRTKTRAGGIGLGLTICSDIIKAHGGKIWAENCDKGAVLHFTIPSIQVRQINNTAVSYSEVGAVAPTVLIIDDEAVCLLSMELILTGTKYKLVKANGGAEGLKYLRTHYKDIDVVLLDLMMPDMYGLDVLQKIKSNAVMANIPVILQSGISNMSEINKAYDMGIAAYIKKPYQRDLIIDALHKVLF